MTFILRLTKTIFLLSFGWDDDSCIWNCSPMFFRSFIISRCKTISSILGSLLPEKDVQLIHIENNHCWQMQNILFWQDITLLYKFENSIFYIFNRKTHVTCKYVLICINNPLNDSVVHSQCSHSPIHFILLIWSVFLFVCKTQITKTLCSILLGILITLLKIWCNTAKYVKLF